MLSVKSNLLAMNADRQLGINTKKNTKITEKLSSGYKINRAADDAAGLAISEKMRRQIRGLSQGASNIKDGIGYVQTAEGALNEVHDMLQRINELSVKAANGTWTVEDRAAINSEIQQLKVEMNRIFSTTTFNEQKIWESQEIREIVGAKDEDAVTFINTSQSNVDITNKNCGVIPLSRSDSSTNYGFKINADEKGVYVSWLAYDGKTYETEVIPWVVLERDNYRFEISEHFGGVAKNPNLYGPGGETDPLLKYEIAFSPNKNITDNPGDIIKSINGQRASVSTYARMEVRFEDNKANPVTYTDKDGKNSITIYNPSLVYKAAFASNYNTGTGSTSASDNLHDFDKEDDDFLVPVDSSGTLVQTKSSGGNLTSIPSGVSSVDAAKKSSETWQFSFYMGGIGTVKATSTSVSYNASSEYGDKYRFYWWDYHKNYKKPYDGTFTYDYTRKDHYPDISISSGTLGTVMGTLTGKTQDYPGLLTPDKEGYSDSGGYIDLKFTLTADSAYKYGDTTSKEIGTFTMRIQVRYDDDEDEVLERINNVLNSDTILDFYVPNGTRTYGYANFSTASTTGHTIPVPVYGSTTLGGTKNFFVQAGAEAGQHIDIEYECLSLEKIGMEDTNTLTEEAAGNAINEVKAAMTIISKQRSDFGAYQNRLEHAYNINNNTVENTQSAESLIRDTDIADAMMEYSVNNILLQAGVSMLTQANQFPNKVIELLNA